MQSLHLVPQKKPLNILGVLCMCVTGLQAQELPLFQRELLYSGRIWTFQTQDGLSLKGRHWSAAGHKTKAVLVAVHGTQTHAGWFGALAHELSAQGWDVYAPDRRGSGLNALHSPSGLPLPVDSNGWPVWVQDLDSAIARIARQISARPQPAPLYLLGSSWGAALCCAYLDPQPSFPYGWKPATAAQVKGLVLSVPSGVDSLVPGTAKKLEVFLLGAVAGKLIPSVRKASTNIGLPARTYSSKEATRLFIGDRDIPLDHRGHGTQDPLVIHRATYAFMLETAALRRRARQVLARWSTTGCSSTLITLLAENDAIVDHRSLLSRIPPGSARRVLPGTHHSLQIENPEALANAVSGLLH